MVASGLAFGAASTAAQPAQLAQASGTSSITWPQVYDASITPGPADNVLEGITAKSVMELASTELGVEIVQREIDRTELYIANEVFMTGTAAHLTPIVEIDRRQVGTGVPGPITTRLSALFYDAIRGRSEKYGSWCTPARARVAS